MFQRANLKRIPIPVVGKSMVTLLLNLQGCIQTTLGSKVNSFPYISHSLTLKMISTPISLSNIFYVALDRTARTGDEFFAISVGRCYFGIYPAVNGVDICWGILDDKGCLD